MQSNIDYVKSFYETQKMLYKSYEDCDKLHYILKLYENELIKLRSNVGASDASMDAYTIDEIDRVLKQGSDLLSDFKK